MPTAYLAPLPSEGGIPGPDTAPASNSNDGLTAANPITRKRAITLGFDTLLPLPGVYIGADSMLRGMSAGITIEGVPNELTLFDCKFGAAFANGPIRGPGEETVRYIQGCNGDGGYCCVRGAKSTYEYCEFWNDTPPQGEPLPQNCHIFSLDTQVATSGDKTTSNEIAAFGMARKMYQNYRSEWIDDNHLWCRFDGITKDENDPLEFPSVVTSMACAAQYQSGNVIVRNSIFASGENVDLRAAEGRPVSTQIIGSDAPHLTMGIEYTNCLGIANQQWQPPYPQSFMTISKIWRLGAMDTVLDNCHAVGFGYGRPGAGPPDANEQYQGVEAFALAQAINPPKTGIYRNCWYGADFFNKIVDPWIQEGDFTAGVAPHLWPTLSDDQWKRIQRATRMSSWPEAVKPGDQLVREYATNWNTPTFHRHERKAYSFLKPLKSNDT